MCCNVCADACLAEPEPEAMRRCIRLDLDCADICTATAAVLSRQTTPNWELLRAQLVACRTACRVCAEECASHADMHDHCKTCAECCRRCADACQQLMSLLPAGTA